MQVVGGMVYLIVLILCLVYVVSAISSGVNILVALGAGVVGFVFLTVIAGWVLELIQTSLRFIFMIGLLIYKALEKLFRKN